MRISLVERLLESLAKTRYLLRITVSFYLAAIAVSDNELSVFLCTSDLQSMSLLSSTLRIAHTLQTVSLTDAEAKSLVIALIISGNGTNLQEE